MFKLAALVLFIFALIVAAGGSFVTTWQVWLTAGLVAVAVNALLGETRVVRR